MKRKIILFVLSLFTILSAFAQQCIIDTLLISEDHGINPDSAYVDFISSNPLNIKENSDAKIIELEPIDGQRRYRALCYVPDGETKVFFISSEGGMEEKLRVYLNPLDYHKYGIKVSKIISVKWEEEKRLIEERADTAAARISCKSDKLIIKTQTGDIQPGPKLEDGWYVYRVLYDVSTPEKMAMEHVVNLSLGDSVFISYTLGRLNAGECKSIIVLIMESCYEQNINHANEFFRKGLYNEAYHAYLKAFECSDKPIDIVSDEARMKNMNILDKASKAAHKAYADAENLRLQKNWKECLALYQKAYTYRLGILKMNPTDEYCLQHQKIYEDLKKRIAACDKRKSR